MDPSQTCACRMPSTRDGAQSIGCILQGRLGKSPKTICPKIMSPWQHLVLSCPARAVPADEILCHEKIALDAGMIDAQASEELGLFCLSLVLLYVCAFPRNPQWLNNPYLAVGCK